MTLFHELFESTAARMPGRSALRHRDREWSYSDVRERSASLAASLAELGVRRGARVAMYLQNRPEVVELALACSRLGAIFVPVNPMLRTRQLSHVLQDSGASVFALSASALPTCTDAIRAASALRALIVCDATGELQAMFPQVSRYEALLDSRSDPPPCGAIEKDPAAILYTSGSAGRPKGVVVSHRNLVAGASCVSSYLDNGPEDRLLAALPLSFDYGFSQVSTAFAVGACAVLTSFSTASALIQEVNGASATGLAGVPTMWAHVAASELCGTMRTLRYITNSGGPLSPAVIQKLQARLPHARIFCMYGLTEAFRSTFLDPSELPGRMGSIGKAVPHQEILVLRPDGSHCEPGEVGELVHRGSLVTLGYWNDPELTRHRFRPVPSPPGLTEEVAVWSGDLVRADEQGFLYFIGRNDQLIKTSGNRVSPTEIEEIALEVPGVIEALALGLPDEVLGHRIALALVVAPESAGLIDAVRHHVRVHLPSYMVPAYIQVVPDIPRNANGKHDRAAMAAKLLALVTESNRTLG